MSATFMIPNDLSDLCRVCLQLPEESQYLDLNTICDENGNLTYSECFTICTQIDLSAGEGVPHHLCKACGFELQMSYDFHKKIEQSKRVIEHCQRQIKENEHSTKLSTQVEDESDMVQMLSNKYEINDYDMQLPGTSPKMHHVSEPQYETTFEAEDDKTDELDVLSKLCQSDIHNTNEDINSGVTAPITEADTEEHLDGEDYQNLEALEEEEKTRRKFIINIKKEKCSEDQQINYETHTDNSLNYATNQQITIENILEMKMDIPDDYDDPLKDDTTKKKEHCKDSNELDNEIITPELNTTPLPSHQIYYQSKIGDPSQFICEFCGYKLPSKSALYKHRFRKHRKEKDYKYNTQPIPVNCDSCLKTFKTIAALKTHMETEHSKITYTCQHCGHKLPTKNALSQHRLRKHRALELQQKKFLQFKCTQCSETFNTDKGLNLHKQSHHLKRRLVAESEPWHECDDCGHKLPTKNALSQHRLRKHRNKKRSVET